MFSSRQLHVIWWPVFERYELKEGVVKASSLQVRKFYNPMGTSEVFMAIQRVNPNKEKPILRFVSNYGLLSNQQQEPFEQLKKEIEEFKFLLRVYASLPKEGKDTATLPDREFIDNLSLKQVSFEVAGPEEERPILPASGWDIAGFKRHNLIAHPFTDGKKHYAVFTPSDFDWEAATPKERRIQSLRGWVTLTLTRELKGVSPCLLTTKAKFIPGMGLKSLLQSLYLKVFFDITSGIDNVEYKICENRSYIHVFAAGPGGDRRKDAKTCSNSCGALVRKRRQK
jgi:hypothetical protein